MAQRNLYNAVCKDRNGGPRHWILILAKDGAKNGTWYHVTGGAAMDKPYVLEIQTKRVDSHGIEKNHIIGQISEKDVNKIKSSAQKVTPKFCQRWVVDVLADLKKKKLVPVGTSDGWNRSMEKDPYSDNGANDA